MPVKETAKRYAMFLSGVLVCAVGIALITRAGLGTSPVSSAPFVLSLVTPPVTVLGRTLTLSMGVYTFAFNMLFLVCEALLLRRISWLQALQIPATLLLSFCLDGALALIPTQYGGPYPMSLLFLLLGCPVMALGITLEVCADVIMLPGEALVRALAQTLHRNFGSVKVAFDIALTVIAALIALAAFHRLNGVREGTLAAALLVGQLVKPFQRRLAGITRLWLSGGALRTPARKRKGSC